MLSWLVVTLHAMDDGTRLELVHEAPVDPEFWNQFGPGAVGVGWDLSLVGLGLHVDTGEPVDRAMGESFPLTPRGTASVRASADAWAAAAAADGDPVDAAQGAADRTFAFYTTVPDPDATDGGDEPTDDSASEG